jgi:flagellar assembly factor FliW
MASLETKYFGRLSYEADAEFEFPRGIPGFENWRKFMMVTLPESAPLMFLQSLEDPALCFITLPIFAVDPDYRLAVSAEDLEQLDLPPERQPRIGKEVLCLAVVSVQESGPTFNLLAPIVVNISNRKAVQAIAQDSGYSHRHVLAPEMTAACS